jgi:hypothetical protein
LNGVLHADLVCQENGKLDLGTKGRPWPIGERGWGMPGAPSEDWRKYRFEPDEAAAKDEQLVADSPTG